MLKPISYKRLEKAPSHGSYTFKPVKLTALASRLGHGRCLTAAAAQDYGVWSDRTSAIHVLIRRQF